MVGLELDFVEVSQILTGLLLHISPGKEGQKRSNKAPAIKTDREPASGIELIAKVQRALERTDLSRIRTHDVPLVIFCQTATLELSVARGGKLDRIPKTERIKLWVQVKHAVTAMTMTQSVKYKIDGPSGLGLHAYWQHALYLAIRQGLSNK